jgi:hypothetical protein
MKKKNTGVSRDEIWICFRYSKLEGKTIKHVCCAAVVLEFGYDLATDITTRFGTGKQGTKRRQGTRYMLHAWKVERKEFWI